MAEQIIDQGVGGNAESNKSPHIFREQLSLASPRRPLTLIMTRGCIRPVGFRSNEHEFVTLMCTTGQNRATVTKLSLD